MLGFPIAFTLMAMGLFFGYLGMQERVFDLLVQRTYAVMRTTCSISIPLFVFMGYIIERANILDRLFRSLQMASGSIPGIARGRDARDLRAVRHRHRHRRRGRDADGAAGLPGDAARGLRREARVRRDLRGRLPRHPDPALDHADPLWRDGGRLGRAALRRGLHPGRHARAALHHLCRSASRIIKPGMAPRLPPEEAQRPLRHDRRRAAHLLLPARAA